MLSSDGAAAAVPVLRARGLTRAYGKGESAFTALRGVDLSVDRGRSVAIVGKSGSGKSTLMHLLALLDKPTTGDVEVEGRPASRWRAGELNSLRNKTFGFVFQQFFLTAGQTVFENVSLPLVIAGMPRPSGASAQWRRSRRWGWPTRRRIARTTCRGVRSSGW